MSRYPGNSPVKGNRNLDLIGWAQVAQQRPSVAQQRPKVCLVHPNGSCSFWHTVASEWFQHGSSMVPTCSNIQLERNGICCQQGAIGCKMAQETYRTSVCDPNFSCGCSGAAKLPNDLPVLKPSWRQTTKASTSSKLSSPHAMKHLQLVS